MGYRRRSTIFKKWDLQVTFPATYLQGTYVHNRLLYTIDTSSTCSAHDST